MANHASHLLMIINKNLEKIKNSKIMVNGRHFWFLRLLLIALGDKELCFD